MIKGRALLILSLFLVSLPMGYVAFSRNPIPVYNAGAIGTTDYPWVMFRHDSLRSGSTLARGPTTPSIMWSYSTGASVYASASVTDGLVFMPSWDGTLYVVDEYTGQLKWSFSTGAPIFSSPAVSGGTVFLASRNGVLYALNEQTGGSIWSYGTSYPITSSPAVADGRVFFGNWCGGGLCNPPGHFVALNATTGAFLWPLATTPSASVVSSPSVHGGHVFFGEDDGTVVSLDESTGVAVWSVVPSGTTFVRTAPAIAYGTLYLGTGNGFLALDEQTGATKWTFNTTNKNATSAAVSNGVVYFGTGKGNVYALNATTGATKWPSPATTGGAVSSSPALSLGSGIVYVGSNDHNLYALNSTNGSRLWTYPTGGPIFSSPAVADGRVYFGSLDDKVYALGNKIPGLQSSITPSATSLRSGDVSILTTTVTNGTAPESGVIVTYASSLGGSFTPYVMTSLGVYVSNFTAPSVSASAGTVITATVSKPGFLDNSTQTSIMISPLPILLVTVSPRPQTVSPGGDVVLEIRVTNRTQSVVGANISFTSSAGGGFSTPLDGGNGNYTVIFHSPLQYATSTITVAASKPGFDPGQGQASITMSGIPDITSPKLAGVPVIILIVGFAVFMIMIIFGVASRRKSTRLDVRSFYDP